METRSNHILVGSVVLFLLAALAAFIIWIAGMNRGATKEYDIFFAQAVDGLNKGAQVTFAGVPKGIVKEIALWAPDPKFVRVRISVDKDLPVLIGTTATIDSNGFTSPPIIKLYGAVKGAPPITEPGLAGIPQIPTRTTGLGAVLNSAPQIVERLSALVERLTEVLSDDNQRTFGNTLANIDRLTKNADQFSGNLARTGPNIEAGINDLRNSIKDVGGAAARIGNAANRIGDGAQSIDRLVAQDGKAMIGDLRSTMARAEKTLASLESTVSEIKPGVRAIREDTLPEVNALVRDLRSVSDSLGAVASKIDQQGAGALLGGPGLPDYKPGKGK